MKKLGFGLMRLPLLEADNPKSIDLPQVCQMVDTFLERGFTYFDTAYMYHQNESEAVLCKALVERHPRSSFTVATKLPTMFLKTQEDQERIFTEQLQKCGVDYFDYYLLHNMTNEHYEIATRLDSFAFATAQKQVGKIRQLGFSHHGDAKLLDEILTAHPNMDFVQLQVNYLDWKDPNVQSGDCCAVAKRHGKPVIIMEPVKGGTLTGLPAAAAGILAGCQPDWSQAEWAIRFAASTDNVMMVLSGMSSLSQLEENTRFMSDFQPLSPAEFAALEAAADAIRASITVACTGCRYCVDVCPKGIAIPEFFSIYNAAKRAHEAGFSHQLVYYDNCADAHGPASGCIGCHKCEAQCPQQIAIADRLLEVVALFENA